MNDDFYLNEESAASQKAKQYGLTYAGFGKWKDKSGNTVAKTEDGKLKKIAGKGWKFKDNAPKSAKSKKVKSKKVVKKPAKKVVKKPAKKVVKKPSKKKIDISKKVKPKKSIATSGEGPFPGLPGTVKGFFKLKGKSYIGKTPKLNKAQIIDAKHSIIMAAWQPKISGKVKADMKKMKAPDFFDKYLGTNYGGNNGGNNGGNIEEPEREERKPDPLMKAIKQPKTLSPAGKKNRKNIVQILSSIPDKSMDDIDNDIMDLEEIEMRVSDVGFDAPTEEAAIKKALKILDKHGIEHGTVDDYKHLGDLVKKTIGPRKKELYQQSKEAERVESSLEKISSSRVRSLLSPKSKSLLRAVEKEASKTRVGNLIDEFTGEGYENISSGSLSKIIIAAGKKGKLTASDIKSDYRLARAKKLCSKKSEVYPEDEEHCENLLSTDKEDIHNLQQIRHAHQQALMDTGLVDEKGMVTLFRGVSNIPGKGAKHKEDKRFTKFNYKGSSCDSWTWDPEVCTQFGSNVITAKIHISSVIACPGLSQSGFMAQSGTGENEVIVDSRKLNNCVYGKMDDGYNSNGVSEVDMLKMGHIKNK